MPHVRWIKNLCKHITTKKKECNYPIQKIKNHENNRGSQLWNGACRKPLQGVKTCRRALPWKFVDDVLWQPDIYQMSCAFFLFSADIPKKYLEEWNLITVLFSLCMSMQ